MQIWILLPYPRIKKRISQHNLVKDNPSDYLLNTVVIKNQPRINLESRINQDQSDQSINQSIQGLHRKPWSPMGSWPSNFCDNRKIFDDHHDIFTHHNDNYQNDSQNLGHRWGQAYKSPSQLHDRQHETIPTDVDIMTTFTTSTIIAILPPLLVSGEVVSESWGKLSLIYCSQGRRVNAAFNRRNRHLQVPLKYSRVSGRSRVLVRPSSKILLPMTMLLCRINYRRW